MVDFDSSHCVEFTRRINHIDIEQDQWVDGARVVIGCPGASVLSPERLPGFTAEMTQLGVPLVDEPTAMIGAIDAVMIESVDGQVHLDRARPFLEAGVPCFVDKPFTCDLDQARRLADLADRRGVPLFSASALRYAPELVDFVEQTRSTDSATGPVVGALTYGPSPVHARNPGLFHYGMHATEVLFALLGSSCRWVTCVREGGEVGSEKTGAEAVTGYWSDGRIGAVRGIRTGAVAWGFLAFCEKQVAQVHLDLKYVYRELLKRVIQMFETGHGDVAPADTVRLMAFLEAALRSGRAGGTPEPLCV
jgi:predicted dehydrogenase